jgi:hypothetical protein
VSSEERRSGVEGHPVSHPEPAASPIDCLFCHMWDLMPRPLALQYSPSPASQRPSLTTCHQHTPSTLPHLLLSPRPLPTHTIPSSGSASRLRPPQCGALPGQPPPPGRAVDCDGALRRRQRGRPHQRQGRRAGGGTDRLRVRRGAQGEAVWSQTQEGLGK